MLWSPSALARASLWPGEACWFLLKAGGPSVSVCPKRPLPVESELGWDLPLAAQPPGWGHGLLLGARAVSPRRAPARHPPRDEVLRLELGRGVVVP